MSKFDWRIQEPERAVTRVKVAGSTNKKDYAAKLRYIAPYATNRRYHLSIDWLMLNAALPTESFEAALDIANKILDAWGFEPVKEESE